MNSFLQLENLQPCEEDHDATIGQPNKKVMAEDYGAIGGMPNGDNTTNVGDLVEMES